MKCAIAEFREQRRVKGFVVIRWRFNAAGVYSAAYPCWRTCTQACHGIGPSFAWVVCTVSFFLLLLIVHCVVPFPLRSRRLIVVLQVKCKISESYWFCYVMFSKYYKYSVTDFQKRYYAIESTMRMGRWLLVLLVLLKKKKFLFRSFRWIDP